MLEESKVGITVPALGSSIHSMAQFWYLKHSAFFSKDSTFSFQFPICFQIHWVLGSLIRTTLKVKELDFHLLTILVSFSRPCSWEPEGWASANLFPFHLLSFVYQWASYICFSLHFQFYRKSFSGFLTTSSPPSFRTPILAIFGLLILTRDLFFYLGSKMKANVPCIALDFWTFSSCFRSFRKVIRKFLSTLPPHSLQLTSANSQIPLLTIGTQKAWFFSKSTT